MLIRLSKKLQGWAKGWLVFILFLLDAAFAGFVMPIAGALMSGDQGGPGPLDFQFFYTPQKAFEMIEAYGPYGRPFYRSVELSLDIVYPIIYTFFYSLLITWLLKRGFAENHPIQKWNVIPFGGWLFDLLENIGIVILLSVYPSTPAGLAWVTTIFTMVKWLFAAASMALVLIGLLAVLGTLFRRKQLQQT